MSAEAVRSFKRMPVSEIDISPSLKTPFFCRLNHVHREIRGCLEILQVMSKQWETAKHCHTALSFLLLNIQRMNQQHQNAPPVSLNFEERGVPPYMLRSKRQKVTHAAFDDQTSSRSTTHYGDDNLAGSLSVAPDQNPNPENQTLLGKPIEFSQSTRTPFQSRNSATYNENPESRSINNNNPSPYSPPLMIMGGTTNSHLEESLLQWPPGGPTMTTNFDLNMTDLFQGSTWDPSLFDAFTQGQLPSQDDL
jgi:hypothetical protein